MRSCAHCRYSCGLCETRWSYMLREHRIVHLDDEARLVDLEVLLTQSASGQREDVLALVRRRTRSPH